MSSYQEQPPGPPRPWLATARALQVMIGAGRRELAERGAVDNRTWDGMEALLDQLIEQLPNGEPAGR